jgi:uncharacterized membrane protein YfcA
LFIHKFHFVSIKGSADLNFIELVFTGLGVGFAVGLTGIGGGSLMTPILLAGGYSPPVAIGTDLLFAAFTKTGGLIAHHRQGSINWCVVRWLAAGSIPTSLIINFLLVDGAFHSEYWYEALLRGSLGIMLLITGITVVGKKYILKLRQNSLAQQKNNLDENKPNKLILWILGILLGTAVTLSSVGAGAFGAAALMLVVPSLKAARIVGTDIAHAVPLTLLGGLGYLYHGLVDLSLLGALLCGSFPGITLGSMLSQKLPEEKLQLLLGCLLIFLGLRLTIA